MVKPCRAVAPAVNDPVLCEVDTDSCVLYPFETTTAEGAVSSSSFPLGPGRLLASDLVQKGLAEMPRIVTCGWHAPVQGWEGWVNAMARDKKVVSIWRKAGIDDAIFGSLSNVIPDRHAVEALVGFWCSSTNTFVFPWGEASFTLEDAFVLGNLSLRGSQLNRTMTCEEEELRMRLIVEREKIIELHPKAKACGKVTQEIWLQWFLALNGEDELRHLGFLAYWLAVYVIPPCPDGKIPNLVFALAARLSKGERIALAPIVTANMYYDLTRITASIVCKQGHMKERKITVWAQFRLLQVWIWERFDHLNPATRSAIPMRSKVRISQWNRRKRSSNYDEAVQIFREERHFNWRPYTKDLANWNKPSWYNHQEYQATAPKAKRDWVLDFVSVMSASTVVGAFGDYLISSERYQPHRVARQFGYDQAIPISCDAWVSLWASNNTYTLGTEVYIPSATRLGNLDKEYTRWWSAFVNQYQKALEECSSKHNDSEIGLKKDRNVIFRLGGIRTDTKTSYQGEKKEEKVQENRCISLKEQGMNFEVKIKGSKGAIPDSSNHETQKHAGTKRKVEEISKIESLREAEHQDEEPCTPRSAWTSHVDPSNLQQTNGKRTDTIKGASAFHSEQFDIIDVDMEDNNVAFDEHDKKLVHELEGFLCCGLLTEWEPSSPEAEEKAMEGGKINVKKNEDPYGQDAIRMYPRFFELIPQKPHYQGLLHENASEEIRSDVYLSKWYLLVDLMRLAVRTSCDTDTQEIQNLMNKAQKLEGFGFNVKHLIARLKEPLARLKELEAAKFRLGEAKRREQKERELATLESDFKELENKLRIIEKRLIKCRKAIGLTGQEQVERTTRMAYLRSKVEDAESDFRAMEHAVAVINDKALKHIN